MAMVGKARRMLLTGSKVENQRGTSGINEYIWLPIRSTNCEKVRPDISQISKGKPKTTPMAHEAADIIICCALGVS